MHGHRILQDPSLALEVPTVTFSDRYLLMPKVCPKPLGITLRKPKVNIAPRSTLKCLSLVKLIMVGINVPWGHILVISDKFHIWTVGFELGLHMLQSFTSKLVRA